MVLDEVLNKLQDFCWITQEKDQVSMLEKFCNKYFEINAGHFSKGSPPMIFKKAYALAQEMLRDSGHRADPLSNVELTRLHQVDKRGGGGGGGSTLQVKEKIPTKTKAGEDVCFAYNSQKGCVEGQKAGVSPGGHCQRGGKKFIHVCSHFDFVTKELCAKNHSRNTDHKK